MEPLFENHLVLDRETLKEWYRQEFFREHRAFVAINAVVVGVYVLLAAGMVWGAAVSGFAVFWVAAAGFALLALVFLVNLLLRWRLEVRRLMREDKGKRYPGRYTTLFYAGAVLPVQSGMEDEAAGMRTAGKVAGYLGEAEALQKELAELGRRYDEEGEGLGGMLLLREELTGLQEKMENLAGAVRQIGTEGQYAYQKLDGYSETKNLQILQYEAGVVLVAKDGFAKGSPAAFNGFIRGKIAQVRDENADPRVKRRMEKILVRYFGQSEGENGNAGL